MGAGRGEFVAVLVPPLTHQLVGVVIAPGIKQVSALPHPLRQGIVIVGRKRLHICVAHNQDAHVFQHVRLQQVFHLHQLDRDAALEQWQRHAIEI